MSARWVLGFLAKECPLNLCSPFILVNSIFFSLTSCLSLPQPCSIKHKSLTLREPDLPLRLVFQATQNDSIVLGSDKKRKKYLKYTKHLSNRSCLTPVKAQTGKYLLKSRNFKQTERQVFFVCSAEAAKAGLNWINVTLGNYLYSLPFWFFGQVKWEGMNCRRPITEGSCAFWWRYHKLSGFSSSYWKIQTVSLILALL